MKFQITGKVSILQQSHMQSSYCNIFFLTLQNPLFSESQNGLDWKVPLELSCPSPSDQVGPIDSLVFIKKHMNTKQENPATTHQYFNMSDKEGRQAVATFILACLTAGCQGRFAYPTHSIPDHQTSHCLDHDFSIPHIHGTQTDPFVFFHLTPHSFHPCKTPLLLHSNSSILLCCSTPKRFGKTRSSTIALA